MSGMTLFVIVVLGTVWVGGFMLGRAWERAFGRLSARYRPTWEEFQRWLNSGEEIFNGGGTEAGGAWKGYRAGWRARSE